MADGDGREGLQGAAQLSLGDGLDWGPGARLSPAPVRFPMLTHWAALPSVDDIDPWAALEVERQHDAWPSSVRHLYDTVMALTNLLLQTGDQLSGFVFYLPYFWEVCDLRALRRRSR